MNKKYFLYGLSVLLSTLLLNNINNSNAFNKNSYYLNNKNKNAENIINIEDTNLLKAINEQLGKGENIIEPVTKENLESLTELTATKKEIVSIKGLEYAINLTKLSLSNNSIEDITGISKLTELTSLDLGANKLSNISEIFKLTKLKSLSLGANKITDITGIKNLTELTSLSFGANQITDISEISNLIKLETLSLHSNRILDVSPLKVLESITSLRVDRQKPIINLNNIYTEQDSIDVSIKNPIVGQVKDNMTIQDISNGGVYEEDEFKWNRLSLGKHSLTFYFTETVNVGTSKVGFYGTTTINLNITNKSNEVIESFQSSCINNENFKVYVDITRDSLGITADYIIHKGVRQSLPYRFEYDVVNDSNNIIEVYDLIGNIGKFRIKFNSSDFESIIEAGISYLESKDEISEGEISYLRSIINSLEESSSKNNFQNRLNEINPSTTLEKKSSSVNVDVYIKSQNMLSMTLSTNSITFEDYSGVDELEQSNVIKIDINSSLPYQLNAYLIDEMYNIDKDKKIDIDRLEIKDGSDTDYKEFTAINNKLILKDDCNSGNDISHNIDIKLKGGDAYPADIYKTTIKFEVEQK